MYSRPSRLPTRNNTNEIGTHDPSASATWRTGPVHFVSMITNAHARHSAPSDIAPKNRKLTWNARQAVPGSRISPAANEITPRPISRTHTNVSATGRSRGVAA